MPTNHDYPLNTPEQLLAAESRPSFGMEGTSRSTGSADAPDAATVLRALQALGTERSPARLRARVEELMAIVAGATKVVLALWDEDANDWVLPASDGPPEVVARCVPLSVLHHAAGTVEPFLLADAIADDRFARDPYFHDVDCCSMMVVPILHHGVARALLVFEKRASRDVFSGPRRDAAIMVAGQLGIALDNAQLYDRLERRLDEQTLQLREAQSQVLAEARRAGIGQLATNVLHNVGNVLTSVNVSAHVLSAQVRQSPAARVGDVARLLNEQADNLGALFGPGGRGQLLPEYLRELADALAAERQQLLAELERLHGSIDHIKNVVALQQSYAGVGRMLELANISELVDEALRMQEASLTQEAVQVQRDYSPVELAPLDKTRVMQILVNLVENARQAMDDVQADRRIEVAVGQDAEDIVVSVRDFGCGISAENLHRLFSHGFTTKTYGHGFGLHSCAAAARDMGGSLRAHSEGPGTGATFVLRLPAP